MCERVTERQAAQTRDFCVQVQKKFFVFSFTFTKGISVQDRFQSVFSEKRCLKWCQTINMVRLTHKQTANSGCFELNIHI